MVSPIGDRHLCKHDVLLLCEPDRVFPYQVYDAPRRKDYNTPCQECQALLDLTFHLNYTIDSLGISGVGCLRGSILRTKPAKYSRTFPFPREVPETQPIFIAGFHTNVSFQTSLDGGVPNGCFSRCRPFL